MSGYGTVFKIIPTGIYTTIHEFDGTDGANPQAGLVVGTDGSLYGTTAFGGSSGNGTVFTITPVGVLLTLHTFTASTPLGENSDGAHPISALIQGSDGNFYGTTQFGGSANRGVVFKMNPSGSVTTLHNFSDGSVENDGAASIAALVQGSDGDFYGTSPYGGGSNYGAVFKVTPTGSVTVLATFDGISNSLPLAPLVQGRDGDFYGTTAEGGSSNGLGDGTVFKITSSGTLTTLVDFDRTDGAVPTAGLVQGSDGNFYGTTADGGLGIEGGRGTIFEMAPSGVLSVLHNFGDGSVPNDGLGPSAGLIVGSDGNFYGTTVDGGIPVSPYLLGTIFRLDKPGSRPIWYPRSTAVAGDGTARILWTRSDRAAGVWAMNAADAQTAVGTAYGPFPGWNAIKLSTAGDGSSRVLWTRADGAAGVWSFHSDGTETTIGPTYGPYTGWTAIDLATSPDGSSRILWARNDGATGIWTLDASCKETVIGPTYDPVPGSGAVAVSVAGNGTARISWTSYSEAWLWTLDATNVKTAVGTVYGPFAGWRVTDIGTSSDGTSRVLWTNDTGAVGIWTFDAAGTETAIGPTYGLFPGYTAAAFGSTDDQSRILWVNSERAAGLWSFGADDTESVIGLVYGPY